jgi:hypothetical protein
MLFKEIIAVFCNVSKPVSTKCSVMIVKADGTYNYRSALKA